METIRSLVDIGGGFKAIVDWLTANMRWLFTAISDFVIAILDGTTFVLAAPLSFGSTGRQMLLKAELPVALATIMAGVNQTIMLALSMVVIAIVILAVFLDRVTQALGARTQKQT